MSYTVSTFYHLVGLEGHTALQAPWKAFMVEQGVTGTILLTPEGINGTIAGSAEGVEAVLAMLRSDSRLAGLTCKYSYAEMNPFPRTKVRLKRETIPLGVPVSVEESGQYVRPSEWNALLADPRTITIDTRNDYEVQIGHFKGALNPATRKFSQLPRWLDETLPPDKDTPIAMYCTGGIRCEKSTAYVRGKGYRNVYHLQGGILKYLEEVPVEETLWEGDCFVFDDRVAVNHALQAQTHYQVCKKCNTPVVASDVRRNSTNWCEACCAGVAE